MQQISSLLAVQLTSCCAKALQTLKATLHVLAFAAARCGETFPGHLDVFRDHARCPQVLPQVKFPFAFPPYLPLCAGDA